jgi:hypothetical protein
MSVLDYPYAALIDGATHVWLRGVLAMAAAWVGAWLGVGPTEGLPSFEAVPLLLCIVPAAAMGHPITVGISAIMAGVWVNLLAGSRFLPECVLAILLYYLIGAYMIVRSLGSSYSISSLCVLLGVLLLLHLLLRIQARLRLDNMT